MSTEQGAGVANEDRKGRRDVVHQAPGLGVPYKYKRRRDVWCNIHRQPCRILPSCAAIEMTSGGVANVPQSSARAPPAAGEARRAVRFSDFDREISSRCTPVYNNRNKLFCALGVIVTIVVIVLLSVSVANSPDGSVSLVHNKNTGALEKGARKGGTIEFLGPSGEFLSLPLDTQAAEFYGSDRGILSEITSRSLEGLEINLELSVDYKIESDRAYEIVTTFGYEGTTGDLLAFEEGVIRAVRGITRNVASNFTVPQFLNGNRTLIGAAIAAELAGHLPSLYVMFLRASLGQVHLGSDVFEAEFQASQRVDFLLREALTIRQLSLADERHANETQAIALRQERDRVILDAERQLEAAKLERIASVVRAENDAQRALIAENTTIIVALEAARARADKALVARAASVAQATRLSATLVLDAQREAEVALQSARAQLARAQAEREAALVVAQSNVSIAQVDASVRLAAVQASAHEVLVAAYARANGTVRAAAAAAAAHNLSSSVETDLLAHLTAIGATPAQATRWRFAPTHAALLDRSKALFFDYDRTPGALDALAIPGAQGASSTVLVDARN